MIDKCWWVFIKEDGYVGHWFNLYALARTSVSLDLSGNVYLCLLWVSGERTHLNGTAAQSVLHELRQLRDRTHGSSSFGEFTEQMAIDLTDELFIRTGSKYAIDLRGGLTLIDLEHEPEHAEFIQSESFAALAKHFSTHDGALVITGDATRFHFHAIENDSEFERINS